MDSGFRIDNAAPALPSAVAAYPLLGAKIRLQPEPSVKPPKIEKLEHRDLFFSSQSARSHVERYLVERSAHRLSVRFERNAAQSWLDRLMNHANAVLLVEKSSAHPLRADKPLDKPKPAPRDRVAVRLLEFAEITDTPLLQKALVSVSSEPFKVQRFAYVPKTGELHAEAAFEAQGIRREDRPGWRSLMGWLREKMPYQPDTLRPVGVDDSLALRFGRRLRWEAAEQWRDQDGNPVQMMNLMRLDDSGLAQVVRVQEQSELETATSLPLGRPDLRKSWRDKIFSYIESVEQRGYFLQPGHIRQTRHARKKAEAPAKPSKTEPAVSVTAKATPPQPIKLKVGLAENPFATANFSGKKLSPVPEVKPAVAKPTFNSNPFGFKPLEKTPPKDHQ